MTSQALEIYKYELLPFELCSIFIGQLALVSILDHPIYIYKNENFIEVLSSKKLITSEFIRNLAQNIGSEVFIHRSDKSKIYHKLKEQIIKISRSLSFGNPLKNASKLTNLLSMQMNYLYQDPFNDEVLTSQFQSAKNLSNLLFQNRQIHKELYRNTSKQNHHYIINQPMLSSILLLSFAKQALTFNEKEVQQLFLTSYFKDIGMSFIPNDKFEKYQLTNSEQRLFSKHPINSFEILEGRVPLSRTYLKVIKYHHNLNQSIFQKLNSIDENPVVISGLESMLVSAIDILVAMTNERPYRPAQSIYESLELIRDIMSDNYSQEFKSLVLYLKQFFSYN